MKKSSKFIMIISSFFAVSLAQAGESTISGVGRVTAAHDFVQLNVEVKSECFQKPSEAIKSADHLASIVYKILTNGKKNESIENVSKTNGNASRFSKSIYVVKDNGRRVEEVLCLGTFQAGASLTLKTTDVEGFALRFAYIQELIYSSDFQQPFKDSKTPMAYVVLGSPVPQWNPETVDALVLEASEKAIENAQMKMQIYAKSSCVYEWDVVEINTRGRSRNIAYAPEAGNLSNFESGWISESVDVKFSWIGGSQAGACAIKN